MSANPVPELEPVKGFAEKGSSFVSRKEARRFGRDVAQRIRDVEAGRQIHLNQTRRTEDEVRRTVDQLRRRVELAERSWWRRLLDWWASRRPSSAEEVGRG